MILSEFWEKGKVEKVAIHCDTKEKAQKLCKYFNILDMRWCDGKRYDEEPINWEIYEEETCYSNEGTFGLVDSFFKVINFDEIITYAKVIDDDSKNIFPFNYNDWFKEKNIEYLLRGKKYGYVPKEGKVYFILKTVIKGNHKIFVLLDEETNEIFLICENGLKLISEKEEKTSNHLLTFRFNEERKSVTLYEDGEKLEFVKCQPEDKFSWKIGLGVALYKHFKKVGKINDHIEYVKDMVNWKTFYTYIVALAVDFNKEKLERLDARVKKAKLYKEIKIND